jgi:hypothetical protein
MGRAWMLALAIMGCGSSRAPAPVPTYAADVLPQPPRPWPEHGMCVEPWEGCRRFSPAEIDAIQQAVVTYLSPDLLATRPDLARARELALWPINAPFIGGYRAMGAPHYPAQSGLVLRLEGIARHEGAIDLGYEAFITETKKPTETEPGEWTVLALEQIVVGVTR